MDGVFTHQINVVMCENSQCPSGYASSRLYSGGWWPSWVFESPHNMSRGKQSLPQNLQSRAKAVGKKVMVM